MSSHFYRVKVATAFMATILAVYHIHRSTYIVEQVLTNIASLFPLAGFCYFHISIVYSKGIQA